VDRLSRQAFRALPFSGGRERLEDEFEQNSSWLNKIRLSESELASERQLCVDPNSSFP
jgi:hypothetical protein